MIDTCLQYAELLKANANSYGLLVVDHYKLHWCPEFAVQRLFSEASCELDDFGGHFFFGIGLYISKKQT